MGGSLGLVFAREGVVGELLGPASAIWVRMFVRGGKNGYVPSRWLEFGKPDANVAKVVGPIPTPAEGCGKAYGTPLRVLHKDKAVELVFGGVGEDPGQPCAVLSGLTRIVGLPVGCNSLFVVRELEALSTHVGVHVELVVSRGRRRIVTLFVLYVFA